MWLINTGNYTIVYICLYFFTKKLALIFTIVYNEIRN